MIDLLSRRFVMRYLYKRQQKFIRTYPNLCGYAFDAITLNLVIDGRYEREELDFILSRFRDRIAGHTVLDIGANIGNHALAFASIAGRVIALEPHPLTFRLLQLNILHQPCITALNIGASDQTATVTGVTPRDNVGACSIDQPRCGEVVELNVRPVDTLNDLTDVGLIKIDVEGHEEQAIRGMEKLLDRQSPLIILEQNRESICDGSSSAVDLLKRRGYSHLYSIEKRHSWRTRFGRIGHILEGVLMGIPPLMGTLVSVGALDDRDYPCLIASKTPL